ncbi:hypothetical protein AAMO2058_001107400 [Amorphochlora amoebiformis]
MAAWGGKLFGGLGQALYFETGETFGRFGDGSSIILSRDASTVIYVQKDGSQVRFVTRFAPRSVYHRVIPLLNFRNSVGIGPPVVFSRETERQGVMIQTFAPILYANWSTCPQNHQNPSRNRPMTTAGATTKLISLDSYSSLTMLPGGEWFAVTYPVLLKKTLDPERSTPEIVSHRYTHIVTSELHLTRNCPPKWKQAISVAQSMQGVQENVVSPSAGERKELEDQATPLPTKLNTELSPSWDIQISPEDLNILQGAGRIPSYPVCIALWSPLASIRCFRGDGVQTSVVSLVHSDLSTLATGRDPSFITHHLFPVTRIPLSPPFPQIFTLQPPPTPSTDSKSRISPVRYPDEKRNHNLDDKEETSKPQSQTQPAFREKRTYSVHNPPLYFRGRKTLREKREKREKGERRTESEGSGEKHSEECLEYPLRDLVMKMSRLYEIGRAREREEAREGNELEIIRKSQDGVLSDRMVREEYVKGLGMFRAFADGRIRARFVDRAICEMGRDRDTISLLLPCGEETSVVLSSPVQYHKHKYHRYIGPMHQFARVGYIPQLEWDRLSREKRGLSMAIAQRLRSSAALVESTLRSQEKFRQNTADQRQRNRLDNMGELHVLVARAKNTTSDILRSAEESLGNFEAMLKELSVESPS